MDVSEAKRLKALEDENAKLKKFLANYSGFRSGVVVPGTDISLQNRGFGFSLQEGHPDQAAGRKRPFHTIIPGFVMAGQRPLMAFRVMGGPMQAQGDVQMIM